ncbi:hypothetical protein [Parapedobacter soli]|uniref:hypothetical protein n=1 Tax=Parapedobacter soli TaxID=416955 RepID=UPI0021C80748|nr:hypothetical protein [Parapedobacter soli]
MWLARQLSVLVISCVIAECAVGQDDTAVFSMGQARGQVKNPEINEASGLVAAGHKGHFWTHNDSGDQARIFLIDGSARHKATYYLQGITAYDWEDIGMMEREGSHYLLIGDIGDNRGNRPNVLLHILKEPADPFGAPKVDTVPNDRITTVVLQYEDGPRDAESLFFDPIDELLYIISKRDLEVGVYTTPLPSVPGDTLMLRKVATLPHTFITSAAISTDGLEVLVKNLVDVFYWQRRPGESIGRMFRRPAMRQPYLPEPQGEAIAFARDGHGYYTLGEAVLGLKAVLYFYRRCNTQEKASGR